MRIVVLDGFAADQGDAGASGASWRRWASWSVYPRTADGRRGRRAARGRRRRLTNKVPSRRGELRGACRTLRYVGVMATGTNIVDLDAARAAGVAVTNVPGYATEVGRRAGVRADPAFYPRRRRARRRRSRRAPGPPRPTSASSRRPLVELAGKTLVVVGSGAIGGAVARIARGVRHARGDAPRCPGPRRAPAARTPLAEALPRADVVSLHCPLTPRRRAGWSDARFLAAMKPGAILINTGARRAGRRSRAGRGARRRPPGRRRPRRAASRSRRPPTTR